MATINTAEEYKLARAFLLTLLHTGKIVSWQYNKLKAELDAAYEATMKPNQTIQFINEYDKEMLASVKGGDIEQQEYAEAKKSTTFCGQYNISITANTRYIEYV